MALLEGFTKNNSYPWIEEYADTDYSLIANKTITMSDTQQAVTQDNNSQYIAFRMERHYDGVDLADKHIQMVYQNANAGIGTDEVINVQYNEDYIIFGWLMSAAATCVYGNFKFQVELIGTNTAAADYKWISKTYTGLEILKSITDGSDVVVPADWKDEFNRRVNAVENRANELDAEFQEAMNAQIPESVVAEKVAAYVEANEAELATKVEVDELKETIEKINLFSMEEVNEDDTFSIGSNESGGTGSGGADNISVNGVSLDKHVYTLKVGETLQLNATISPSNATNQVVEWTSTVLNYAIVDSNGLVTGVADGEATIEVTTDDGNYVDRCVVTVEAESVVDDSGLIFSLSDEDYDEDTSTIMDSISNISGSITGTLSKDSNGLLFDGTQKIAMDISSLNIPMKTTELTMIIGYIPTDASGSILGLLKAYNTVDNVILTNIEYRGYINSILFSFLTQNRLKQTITVNEKNTFCISLANPIVIGTTENGCWNSNYNNSFNTSVNNVDCLEIGNGFKGYIKNVKIYKKAMTKDELNSLIGYVEAI